MKQFRCGYKRVLSGSPPPRCKLHHLYQHAGGTTCTNRIVTNQDRIFGGGWYHFGHCHQKFVWYLLALKGWLGEGGLKFFFFQSKMNPESGFGDLNFIFECIISSTITTLFQTLNPSKSLKVTFHYVHFSITVTPPPPPPPIKK